MTDLGISGIGDASLIASGGSALVYSATADDGREVAVKVLRGMRGAEVARRFAREQQATERLQEHPNIIDVVGSGVSDGGEPYLIMPLLTRGSLADELDDGAFALERAIADVLAATEAIDFAHRRGVLHRDLKPGNLLRTDDDSVVVTDFGIARVVDAGISSATVGATTPLYAAPELLSNNEASVQSDVYSLAAVLYALLAGKPAFADTPNIWATIGRIRSDTPAEIESVPAPVMRVILQAMAKEPSGRPPTAHQFHLNLLAARDAHESWTPPSPAEVTMPAPPPGPAMVPAITVATNHDTPEIVPANPSRPSAPPDLADRGPAGTTGEAATAAPADRPRPRPRPPAEPRVADAPAPPTAPASWWDRRSVGATRAVIGVAVAALIALIAWFALNRVYDELTTSDDDTTQTEITGPIDTSLPSPSAGGDSTSSSATAGDGTDASSGTVGNADDPDADDPDADDPDADGTSEQATSDDPDPSNGSELVSFTGQHFTAYFPEGWSVARSDVDVGYGYRSQFVGPGDLYLNIDTTPAERRTGSQSIEASAREIAAAVSSASAVTSEDLDGLEVHWFTFRNNRGVESIDMFFEVEGDGYAIVAGSNSQPETAYAIARQVALTIRSSD